MTTPASLIHRVPTPGRDEFHLVPLFNSEEHRHRAKPHRSRAANPHWPRSGVDKHQRSITDAVERVPAGLRSAFRFSHSALPFVVLLLLTLLCHPTFAATQVGSAPYRASATGAGNSHSPVFSADGRHVAFVSQANNLVTNDDLGPHLDLFVRDLVASNTVLVSVSTNGFGGANDNVGLYSLSSNAQVIAFDTAASNLIPWDNNRASDIYARDLVLGSLTRVSMGVDGDANGPSYNPLVSEDGRYIIFESLASNLVTNDFNGTNDIFIHDLTTGLTTLVSVNADGTASPNGPSHSPSISADGLKVAFVSRATNVVAGVANPFGEVYLRDVLNGSNLLAMASQLKETHGRFPFTNSYNPSQPILGAEGRFVLFRTLGSVVRFDFLRPTNYVDLRFPSPDFPALSNTFSFYDNPRLSVSAGDEPLAFTPDGRFAVYVTPTNNYVPPQGIIRIDYETLVTNTFKNFVDPGGTHGGDTNYYYYATNVGYAFDIVVTNATSGSGRTWTKMTRLEVNDDATRLFFVTDATNLVSIATNRTFQLYGLKFPNEAVQLITANLRGEPGPDLGDVAPTLAPDGSLIAWDSPDDNIVADDMNRAWDVFVRNVDTGETQVISTPHPGLPPMTGRAMASIAGRQSISGDGSKVVVLSRDSNLTTNDTNTLTDAILRDLQTQTNFAVSGAFLASILPTWPIWLLDSTNEVFTSAISANGQYVMFGGRPFDPGRAPFSLPSLQNWTNLYWRDLRLETNDFFGLTYGTAVSDMPLNRDGEMVAFNATVDYGPSLNSPGEYVFDVNRVSDVFIRDHRQWPWRTLLMSISTQSRYTNGGFRIYSANGPSINPVFSPNSRWLVFQSLATDLTYDTGNVSDYQLYAREVDSYFIKRISYSGSEGTNAFPLSGGATNPVFSADACFVFFEGSTSNLIYRHDLLNDMDDTGTARRPNLVVCAGCANPSASSEGRFVAYESRPGPGGGTNVFVKDLVNGQVELISVSMTGTNGNGPSFTPLISHDARFVVFASKAGDLVPNDNNRVTDIFVRDRFAGVTHCLSRNFAGTGTGNRVSSNPIMSADGRTVAFQSFASDLVPGDYNDTRDVFVVTLGGPDTDGDGMDDDWEMAYFSTLARDGSGDFDHDGATDLAEFRAGTNPANDTSILRVLTLTTSLAAGPNPRRTTVLLWSAIPGKTYRVQSKAGLDAPWTTVGADITAGSTSASLTDTVEALDEPNNPHRFYRVLLVQ